MYTLKMHTIILTFGVSRGPCLRPLLCNSLRKLAPQLLGITAQDATCITVNTGSILTLLVQIYYTFIT